MEITIEEIAAAIEDFAPLSLQESWDNSGLIVGSPRQTVSKALLTIDVTEAVVFEAVEVGAALIISHHPVILSGVRKLTGDTEAERAVIAAIRHGVAIYAAHTNMDVAQKGVSYRMAQKLGLNSVQVLSPSGEHSPTGLGVTGMLPAPLNEDEFLTLLKSVFHLSSLRHTPLRKQKINKAALCGGSGSSLIADAIRSGSDVFVTADIKYHQFADASKEILIADIGHFESEQYTKEIFYEILTKKIPTFALQFSKVNTNPITYL
ncbi:MAG: Nif3-like dinuclear metal center hexameric protein [Bacteroidales bacterium]|jgi:dinuclear metal center YbgI/SA1388 family protein|nr:Nif3-like dinuclear metal center hexameric protein [Bacteroidales bacterium]